MLKKRNKIFKSLMLDEQQKIDSLIQQCEQLRQQYIFEKEANFGFGSNTFSKRKQILVYFPTTMSGNWINAREEFLDHVGSNNRVVAAQFRFLSGTIKKTHTLFLDHSEQEWHEFLELLDFDYNAGYGEQLLFGNIWYDDKTYSERREYDGSEWWEQVFRPIPPTRPAAKVIVDEIKQ